MKKRLLIVDDDSSVREALKKVLEEEGYEVLLAAGGEQAESRLRESAVDLLILDLFMPERDGWDVLDVTMATCPLMPVILITGMVDQLATFQIAGASALLAKPIEAPVMLKKIQELLAPSAGERLHGSVAA